MREAREIERARARQRGTQVHQLVEDLARERHAAHEVVAVEMGFGRPRVARDGELGKAPRVLGRRADDQRGHERRPPRQPRDACPDHQCEAAQREQVVVGAPELRHGRDRDRPQQCPQPPREHHEPEPRGRGRALVGRSPGRRSAAGRVTGGAARRPRGRLPLLGSARGHARARARDEERDPEQRRHDRRRRRRMEGGAAQGKLDPGRGLDQMHQRRGSARRLDAHLDRHRGAELGGGDPRREPCRKHRELHPSAPEGGAPRFLLALGQRHGDQRRQDHGLLREQGQEHGERGPPPPPRGVQLERGERTQDREQVLAAARPDQWDVGGMMDRDHGDARERRVARQQATRDAEQQQENAEEQRQVGDVIHRGRFVRRARQRPEPDLTADRAQEVADRIWRAQDVKERVVAHLVEEQVVVREEGRGERAVVDGDHRRHHEPERDGDARARGHGRALRGVATEESSSCRT